MTKKEFIPPNLLLQWHVTERCNLRCEHCYQDSAPTPELDFASLLNILEQFKSLLARFRAQTPLKAHITLTGGEPFVRKDFPQLVEIIAGQPELFSFAILTNGTLTNLEQTAWLAKMKPAFVQVSLEGMQATHDRIRGPGNFEQTLKAIRCLKAEKVPTYISFTAHRQNFREFGEVARLGRKLKVQRVWSDRAIPTGHHRETLMVQMLSSVETRAWLESMAKARREARRDWFNRTEISLNRALQFWAEGDQPYRCSAGSKLICVLPNGDLVPCRRMPIVAGNLRQNTLSELYHCELFETLRNPQQVNAGCEQCIYDRLCGGGLRCMAYALTGSPFQADPGCWLSNTTNSKQ